MGNRGRLRVYLGAAPGVGKTYAMLNEGHRRAERGTDVVVGFVETHGRRHTAEQLEGLEVVPRRMITYRGTSFPEMDVDTVLARRPQVALVDELAHTNVPGSRHEKRHQDVEDLLAAGIDVITTVNIQHLESVNDVVEKITGVPQQETVPDDVVRAADQIELEDMSAEALQRRMAHGNIYPPEKVDAALSNYFRPGNLNALRELALLWTADRVDDALQHYREQHDITGTWEARERVVVALTGGPEGETLIRRAARIAARSSGGDLLALHVASADGLSGASQGTLAAQRVLVEKLGGTYHQVIGDDVPDALLAFARAENATQLVLGESRRTGLARAFGAGTALSTLRRSGDIDVHLVTHERGGRGPALPKGRGSLGRRRRLVGYALAVALPLLLNVVLVPLHGDHLNLVSDVLLFLLVTVVVSLVGGVGPALVAALLASALLNYFFTPPLHTLTISDTNNALALLVFLLVATAVSTTVNLAARRTRQAARAAAESRTLANLAGSVLGGEQALTEMLERVRETFALRGATLLARDDATWRAVAGAGEAVASPGQADTDVPAGEGVVLALVGGPLQADDQRLVGAFAAQAAVVLDRIRLSRAAAEAAPLAEANKLRTALLSAVSHDFRTPLAAAKASVSSLASAEIEDQLTEEDRRELLAAAESSLDRLADLVDNLLDMSRLQAGAMSITVQPTAVEEVVARALDGLGPDASAVVVDPGEGVPLVLADPGLLERVVANLAVNALRFSVDAPAPRVTSSVLSERVEIRVVDRGPGVPRDKWDEVFLPFQRLGDTDNTTGVGLGLALARGLTEAMGGTLGPEETPGGGLTMVIALPAAPGLALAPGRRRAGRGPAVTRVLVVDDEPALLRALAINLKARRYDVAVAATGEEALRVAADHHPDVVVLDLGLPDLDGTEVIAGLRGWTDVPILVLSGRSDSTDKVEALDAGADDYVTKPFGMDELLARLRALTRRTGPTDEQPVVAVGGVTVDLAARRVRRGEDEIRLTPTEWHLLEVLLRHPGRLLSQRQLLQEVWGPGYETAQGNLRLYMAQLRRKLEADPSRPVHLVNEPGMGYRFEP